MTPTIKSEEELEPFLKTEQENSLVLIPPLPSIGKGLALTLVRVDIELSFKDGAHSNGHLWTLDGEAFFFTKNTLERIALAAQVNFTESKMLRREVDNDGRVIYIKHQVKSEYLQADGLIRSSVTSGEYDFEEDIERLRYVRNEYLSGKLIHLKGEPIIELIQSRRHSAGVIAETSAKARALKEIFPELKKYYLASELTKTILVARIVPDVDAILKTNPTLKNPYYSKLLGIKEAMYLSKPNISQDQNLALKALTRSLDRNKPKNKIKPPDI